MFRAPLAPLVYVSGLGSLLLLDLIITAVFEGSVISDWGGLRSVIGIAGIFCLVGLDQVLVRSPQSSKKILKAIFVQVPILAVIIGWGFSYFGFVKNWFLGGVIAAGSAMTLVFFQYFRSFSLNLKSQLSQQGWKIFALLTVLLFLALDFQIELGAVVAVSIWLSILLCLFFYIKSLPENMMAQNAESLSDLYQIGIRFMVTSLMLALTVYAEQLVVNHYGGHQNGALYFTHATYFLFPASILNGYLAFLIGPWVRDNHDRFLGILKKRWPLIVAFSAFFALFVFSAGSFFWSVIGPSVGVPDTILQIVFMVSVVARTLYTLPGGYLGVFGMPGDHNILIVGQLVIFATVLALFFFFKEVEGVLIVYLVSILSALNWVMRTALSFSMVSVIARRKNAKS